MLITTVNRASAKTDQLECEKTILKVGKQKIWGKKMVLFYFDVIKTSCNHVFQFLENDYFAI